MKTTAEKTTITVSAKIKAPIEKVWEFWSEPKHITQWNAASIDWHSPWAQNDLRAGGRFTARMEARDGSSGFDFGGVYDIVKPLQEIAYTMDDGRKVHISFEQNGDYTTVTETFEAENEYSHEFQKSGWQAILDNFKKYVESPFERLHFEIEIDATPEKIARIMLEEKYSEWTSAFNPSSRYEGSWEKGSKILFIGEEDGKEGGMVSRISEHIPSRFVSIEHIGFLQNGEEVTSGNEVEAWKGAQENYTFLPVEGSKTQVRVDLDITQEHKSYFLNTWPLALEKLKTLCETP